jgi:hypothetical protein
MARPKKLKEQEVIEALRQSHGLKTGAAEILGVAYNTLDAYTRESAEAQATIEHWRLRRKDRAEYKLDEAIERGESWAIMFTLKNARDKEYSDRVEVENKGQSKVIVEYVNQNSVTDVAPSADANQAGTQEA